MARKTIGLLVLSGSLWLPSAHAFAQVGEGIGVVSEAVEPDDKVEETVRSAVETASEELESKELPSGTKVYFSLTEAGEVGATKRNIALTAGIAELTGAYLLRNNPIAGQQLSKVATEIKPGAPIGAPAAPVKVGRATRWLRKLGAPGRIAAVLVNVGALRGAARGPRLANLGRRLGGAGRFTTRQVLYLHGGYNVLVGTTGRDFDVGLAFEFAEGDVPAAPEGGPAMTAPRAAEETAAGIDAVNSSTTNGDCP